MRLENKVALISGGARGIGAAEARLFAKEGAKVVIGDILEERGRQTEAEINEAGGDCLFVKLDVTARVRLARRGGRDSWQVRETEHIGQHRGNIPQRGHRKLQ